jgi:hypothetical protein
MEWIAKHGWPDETRGGTTVTSDSAITTVVHTSLSTDCARLPNPLHLRPIFDSDQNDHGVAVDRWRPDRSC